MVAGENFYTLEQDAETETLEQDAETETYTRRRS
jgi:hypothetical protein